eukprot:3217766-Pyramimonas_sp.AAC.1
MVVAVFAAAVLCTLAQQGVAVTEMPEMQTAREVEATSEPPARTSRRLQQVSDTSAELNLPTHLSVNTAPTPTPTRTSLPSAFTVSFTLVSCHLATIRARP